MSKQFRGFTLVEVSLVLVIVSLMLASTVKAAEWVDVSKLRSLVEEFRETPMLVESYRSAFHQLPGDDPRADRAAGIPVAPVTAGNGRIDGGWNSEDFRDESVLLWLHLRAAGIAAGPTEFGSDSTRNEFLPRNPFGGRIGIQGGGDVPVAGLTGPQLFCSAEVPAHSAARLDAQLDDGLPNQGRIRAARDAESPPAAFRPGISPPRPSAARYSEGDHYTVCMGF